MSQAREIEKNVAHGHPDGKERENSKRDEKRDFYLFQHDRMMAS